MGGVWKSMRITSIIGSSVGGLLMILSIPNIIGGIALYKRQVWGRIIALVLCFLSLISIPFGTALGIYGIWVLLNEESAVPSSTCRTRFHQLARETLLVEGQNLPRQLPSTYGAYQKVL